MLDAGQGDSYELLAELKSIGPSSMFLSSLNLHVAKMAWRVCDQRGDGRWLVPKRWLE